MKANELRFGNLVLLGNNIIRIVSIEKNKIKYYFHKKHLYEIDIKEIKPIPLTEEWLLKFGFEKKEGYYDRYYYSIDGMNIKIDDDMFETEVGECLYKSIKYVHQLQNLYFAINDEELTMK